MRKLRFWIGLAAAFAASTGMNSSDVVVKDIRLEPITTCEELERHIEDVAVLEMRALIKPFIQRRLRRNGRRFGLGCGDAVSLGAAPPAEQQGEISNGPQAYTTTNVQVSGVDEPDFVKNDGTRMFVLSGRTLYALKSWPADALELSGQLRIEGRPREMLLDEKNRIVVFSDATPGGHAVSAASEGPCMDEQCRKSPRALTKVTVVDVSELAAPKVLREDYLPGEYRSARRVGSAVRVVLLERLRMPEGLHLSLETDGEQPGRTDVAVESEALENMMEENEAIIRSMPLSDWLPSTTRRRADGSVEELPMECGNFSRVTGPTRLGALTVATLDLDEHDGPIRRDGVIGEVAEVYASPTALYVTNRHWSFDDETMRGAATFIHKFDTTDPSRARYVASGAVGGQIVDQFSLDEYDGHLRVATDRDRASRVFVLGQQGDRLNVVGATEELAPGERLFSARFIGARGYLVTAVVVEATINDPFFTLDLSDPKNPRPIGELKLPGFSTYLHPIDENHVLAIGRDGSGLETKLSLFDVSNFASPREKYQMPVGTPDEFEGSEAETDHRAFTWFPEKKLLAIPFTDWSKSDLRLFEIDPATGIHPAGVLEMTEVYGDRFGAAYFSDLWRPTVRRSVLADDFVYAIADSGIRSARIDALDKPLATVKFQRYDGR